METITQPEGVRLSASAINTYLKCPRDFYYRYIERLPTPLTNHLIKGNIVHKVLERFFDKKFHPDYIINYWEIFDKEWEAHAKEWAELKLPPEALEVEKQDCKNMLELFLYQFKLKMKILLDSGKAENERHAYHTLRPRQRELWIDDKDLNCCGYIDRVHTDFDGTTTITDYKTSSRFGVGNKEEYDLQCAIYALLYKRSTGKAPDYTSIVYLRYGEEVITRVTPYQLGKALEAIEYVNQKTKSTNIEDYPCSQGHYCVYSPWFDKKSGLCDFEATKRQEKALAEMKK